MASLFGSSLCMAAEYADTLRMNRSIDEVVVTGTRSETDIRHLSQTVSVVDRNIIESSMQSSLLPVITEQVPGLFATARGIMGYGVSGGASGSISLRGLSGGSGRLMVLIDGHPQYMGLMGHPISDSYQSLLADRVEVLRGPASMLYGSNAMGGVVNIVSRKPVSDAVRTGLALSYGSYNTLETEFTNRIDKAGFSSVVSGSYNRTDGHRSNMQFEQYGGYAKLGYRFSDNWNAFADVNITHFNASQPGTVDVPLLDADQRITRGMASIAVSNDYANTSGSISLFYNWGRHWINDGYAVPGTPKDYRFDSRDYMMGVSLYQVFRLFEGNRLTVGADLFRFGGKASNKYVEGSRNGESVLLVDKDLNEFAGYADFRQNITDWLTFDGGIRVDHHSQLGTEWIPQVGVALHLWHGSELKLTAAKGFRYPTIKDMYLFPPQNPDLKPESMWNYEMAFSQKLFDGRFVYGVNVFYIDGKNMIVAVPRQGATPLNMNTGKIDNAGIELQAAYRINPSWSVDANYSYLYMDNPVIAAPEHKLFLGCSFARNRWTVSSGVQYIAGLYTSVSPVSKENFVIWNMRVMFHATKWLDLKLRGENLLASKYEINAGYPMPRATVFAGVNMNF